MTDLLDDSSEAAAVRELLHSLRDFEVPHRDLGVVRAGIRRRRQRRKVATSCAVAAVFAAGVSAVIISQPQETTIRTADSTSISSTTSPSILAGRTDYMTARLDTGELLIFGGADTGGRLVFSDGQAFDPSSGGISSIAALPSPRMAASAATTTAGVTVVGGLESTEGAAATSTLRYVPTTQRWSALNDPESFGERPPVTTLADAVFVWSPSGTIWRLASDTERWEQVATMPRVESPAIFGNGDRLILAGSSADRGVAAWVVTGGDVRPLSPLTIPDRVIRSGFVETALVGDLLVAWGYDEISDGTARRTTVAAVQVTNPGASWESLGSLDIVRNDRWAAVVVGSRLWTWQIGGNLAAVSQQHGVVEFDDPAPTSTGTAFANGRDGFYLIYPGAPANDPTGGSTETSYHLVTLPS